MRNGMIRITVRKKVRKYKSVLLYLTVGAPPILGMLFLDAFAKHPGVALGYLLGMIGWDALFAIANKKKPRAATRGMEHGKTDKSFRSYLITDEGAM